MRGQNKWKKKKTSSCSALVYWKMVGCVEILIARKDEERQWQRGRWGSLVSGEGVLTAQRHGGRSLRTHLAYVCDRRVYIHSWAAWMWSLSGSVDAKLSHEVRNAVSKRRHPRNHMGLAPGSRRRQLDLREDGLCLGTGGRPRGCGGTAWRACSAP